MVHEEDAFEVVVFVLDDPGQHAFDLERAGLEVAVEVRDVDLRRAPHVLADVGDGEAAFFKSGLFVPLFDDLGVDEDHRLRGQDLTVLGQFFGQWFEVDEEQPFVAPYLRRRQADAGGVVHGLEHVVDQLLEGLRVFVYFHRLLPEDGHAVDVDG